MNGDQRMLQHGGSTQGGMMDWRNTNLGQVGDLGHYMRIYQQAAKRNPMSADMTFQATVGRFINQNETPAIQSLLQEIKAQMGGQQQMQQGPGMQGY